METMAVGREDSFSREFVSEKTPFVIKRNDGGIT